MNNDTLMILGAVVILLLINRKPMVSTNFVGTLGEHDTVNQALNNQVDNVITNLPAASTKVEEFINDSFFF